MVKKAKKASKTSRLHRMLQLVRSHKLIVFLSLLVLLFPASFIYEKYLDWDNAQMIKGIARDFPELVKQIEAETGLDLEEKTDCMTTSEKFSAGIKLCELTAKITEQNNSVGEKFKKALSKNDNYKVKNEYENKSGNFISYRGEKVCGLGLEARGSGIYSVVCTFGIREANASLAKEVFTK